MWTYEQRTGRLIAPNGELSAVGYSGHGQGLNNPAMEHVEKVGPIPAGQWIIGSPYDSDKTGPFTLPLYPDTATATFGRSGFKIHGDSIAEAGEEQASEGCIVLSHAARVQISDSGDSRLLVVAG